MINPLTSYMPWFTDLSMLTYTIGIAVVLCTYSRIGTLLMQLGIILELCRALIEYGPLHCTVFDRSFCYASDHIQL